MSFEYDNIIYGYMEEYYYYYDDTKECETLRIEKNCNPVVPRVSILIVPLFGYKKLIFPQNT